MSPERSLVDIRRISDDGRKIHIQVDLLSYAIEHLTPQLNDPLKPLCCPLCFVLCVSTLHRPDCHAMLSDLLLHHHAFFDACLAVLAAPRSDADLPILRDQLLDNRARCPTKHWHGFLSPQTRSQTTGDLLEQLVTTLVGSVTSGIRNIKTKGWFKAKARKGSWPTAQKQLFPYGAQPSVASYVFWCRTLVSPSAVPLLALLLEVARSDVIPHILAPPQKDRLMEALIATLSGRQDAQGTPLAMSMQPSNCPEEIIPQRTAAALLSGILYGAGAKLDDIEKMCIGQERALHAALVSVLDSDSEIIRDDMLLLTLCSIAEHIHDQLSLPPSAAQAKIRQLALSCESKLNVPDGMTHGAQLVFMILYHQSLSKTCSAIGCSEPGKQTCSRCKLVRYCGRTCQQNDWRVPRGADGGITHKALCPILCRLRSAGVSAEGRTLRQFLDSYHRANISDDDYDDFVSWGVISGFVPPSS